MTYKQKKAQKTWIIWLKELQ